MKKKNNLKLINRRRAHLVYSGYDIGGRKVYVEFRKSHPNCIIVAVTNKEGDFKSTHFFNYCWYVDYNKYTENDNIEVFHRIHKAMTIPSYNNLDFSDLNCFRKHGGSGWYIRFKDRSNKKEKNGD